MQLQTQQARHAAVRSLVVRYVHRDLPVEGLHQVISFRDNHVLVPALLIDRVPNLLVRGGGTRLPQIAFCVDLDPLPSLGQDPV